MNGNGTLIYRGIIIALFTVSVGMAGYIVTQFGKTNDAGIMAVNARLDESIHRLDRTLDRLNDIDRRLATSEARIMDLQGKR
jgi:hypothetical protein